MTDDSESDVRRKSFTLVLRCSILNMNMVHGTKFLQEFMKKIQRWIGKKK